MSLHWTWGSEWWSFSTFFGRSLFALGLTETLEFLQDLNLEKRWSRMTLNLKSNFSEAAAARIVAINLHRSSWKLASFHPCCLLHFSRKNARDKICNSYSSRRGGDLHISWPMRLRGVGQRLYNFVPAYYILLPRFIILVLWYTGHMYYAWYSNDYQLFYSTSAQTCWDTRLYYYNVASRSPQVKGSLGFRRRCPKIIKSVRGKAASFLELLQNRALKISFGMHWNIIVWRNNRSKILHVACRAFIETSETKEASDNSCFQLRFRHLWCLSKKHRKWWFLKIIVGIPNSCIASSWCRCWSSSIQHCIIFGFLEGKSHY